MDFFILHFEKFMLVFVRILGLMFTATFFSSETMITEARLGLTFVITALIYPLVHQYTPAVPDDFIEFALVAVGEGLIGVAIGFCVDICFSVYQLAGQFFTVQMGFGASEVFDPMSQESIPLVGQYLYILAILVFLSLGGPLLIIKEIFHSYELINFTKFLNGEYIESNYGIIALFAKMFVIAVKISMPIIGTLFLVSVSMGLLSKAAPQMNLLMVGFPISIMISFFLILILLPNLVEFISHYIDDMFKDIWFMMMELSNG
ncbi:MAG TPA: flagellar biosynthetic protein FliR [Spirochaetota bacterium]|nr:flagellar biosynthetic protein FliR [Spirochaetota bacterium]